MLACIACTKDGSVDDTARAETPNTKDGVKSLSSQIKDMVLKLSGMQCKGGTTTSSYRHKSNRYQHHRGGYAEMDDDGVSDSSHYPYLHEGAGGAASSSSTPAWDFNTTSIDGGKGKWVPHNQVEGVIVEEEGNGEPKEWTALVEPGVQITFVSLLGGGGNDLKRIRFSREMFNKWQAQRWWGENFDRIMELYNVQRFSRQALPTPPRSDDGERESVYSRVGSTRESPVTPPLGTRDRMVMVRSNFTYRAPSTSSSRTGGTGNANGCGSGSGTGNGGGYFPSVPDPTEHILPHQLFHHHATVSAAAAANNSSNGNGVGVGFGVSTSSPATAFYAGHRIETIDASRTTTSSRDEAASISISNASDADVSEWVEQDEPGVYITIRELPDGMRELRRVRFSREMFGEVHAKLWWEDNRERIQAQYL